MRDVPSHGDVKMTETSGPHYFESEESDDKSLDSKNDYGRRK